jgi:hypothetical protein
VSPLAFAFAVIALVTSAHTRVIMAGRPVSVLWLLAAALVLVLAAVVLVLARVLIRDGLRLRVGMVAT